MTEDHSTRIDESIQRQRLIGKLDGSKEGPTLIFVAGMHGNEPAGIYALRKVFNEIDNIKSSFKGNMYAVSGNLSALDKGIRYHKQDLNRLWTAENMIHLQKNEGLDDSLESQELKDIYLNIKEILGSEKGPFYFFDLHTTSSETIPFITVNDSLLNRRYTSQYPVPIILGIEEFLNGALLSFINELGYIAFGFEGGQHDDPASIHNHIAFIYLSLVFSGCLEKSDIDFEEHFCHLFRNTERYQSFFEIITRYEIKPFEEFKMAPGFKNFQSIQKGIHLANSNGKAIHAEQNDRIFMPLYQGKGNDGFFMIRKTPRIFLRISSVLRKIRFDKILPLLPGVQWASDKKDELVVNLKVARFFTKKFLHLLGYRNKQIDKTHLRVKNREAASKDADYDGYF